MKQGFQYYNIDTDRYQDIRIKRLKKEMKCVGLAVYDYVLCEIYRVKGCFLEWDEDRAFDVADYLGLDEAKVREVVKYCGTLGLFNEELLSRGIISSASIQQRYLDMCGRAKRKGCEIPESYRLIPEEMAKVPEECAETHEVFCKVKKSKVKKSKEECSVVGGGAGADTAHDDTDFEKFKNFQAVIAQRAPRVAEMAEPFTPRQFRAVTARARGQTVDARTKWIISVLEEMHNKPNLLSENVSAFVTYRKFEDQKIKRLANT